MATTFRVDFRAGLLSVANAYMAANPTLLVKVYDYPPESFDTPCLYIEKLMDERVEHDASLRRRVIICNVVLVNKLMSNAQATHEQDVLVDGLLDAYTTDFHAASGLSLIQPVGVKDTEITAGEGVRYAAAVLTIEGSIQEGRL